TMGTELRAGWGATRGASRCRPGRSTLVLLLGRDRIRSVLGDEQYDLPRAQREDGRTSGTVEGGPRGLRLRGASAGGPCPRGRAVGRARDRAPALVRLPARHDRALATGLRGQPAPDRRDRNGLVQGRGRDA